MIFLGKMLTKPFIFLKLSHIKIWLVDCRGVWNFIINNFFLFLDFGKHGDMYHIYHLESIKRLHNKMKISLGTKVVCNTTILERYFTSYMQ